MPMDAHIFRPSNDFFGRMDIDSPAELTEALRSFFDRFGPPPVGSYITAGSDSWTLISIDPVAVVPGRVSMGDKPDPIGSVARSADGRGWPSTSNLPRWVLREATPFRNAPDESEPVAETLPSGREVDCESLSRTAAPVWVKVGLEDGRIGYIPAITQVAELPKVWLRQATAVLREAPDEDAPPIRSLARNTTLMVVEPEGTLNRGWVRLRCEDGQEGFLAPGTQLARIGLPGAYSPLSDLVIGGTTALAGFVASWWSHSSAEQHGGRAMLFYGAVIFGVAQFLRGIFRGLAK
jgi:hypothetical protein